MSTGESVLDTEVDVVTPELEVRRTTKVRAVLITWLVLLAVGTAVVTWLGVSDHAMVEREDAGTAALARAKTSVTSLLSYDGATILDELDDESRMLTGRFRKQYVALVKNVVGPAAREQRIVTKATIADASVVHADTDEVKTLLFVNLVTTGAKGGAPKVTGSRLVVVMKRVDSTWLISSLEPV